MSRLSEENIKMAYKVANDLSFLPIEKDDILSNCFIGLVKAEKYYDKSKAKFSTLAYLSMKQEVYKRLGEMKRIKRSKYVHCSLNVSVMKKGKPLEIIDNIIDESVQDEFELFENIDFLYRALPKLKKRSRDMLLMYYRDQMRLVDIAAHYDITYQAVQLSIKRSLETLRKEFVAC